MMYRFTKESEFVLIFKKHVQDEQESASFVMIHTSLFSDLRQMFGLLSYIAKQRKTLSSLSSLGIKQFCMFCLLGFQKTKTFRHTKTSLINKRLFKKTIVKRHTVFRQMVQKSKQFLFLYKYLFFSSSCLTSTHTHSFTKKSLVSVQNKTNPLSSVYSLTPGKRTNCPRWPQSFMFNKVACQSFRSKMSAAFIS